MGVIGFSFTSFEAKRDKKSKGQSIEVNHALKITEVEKSPLLMGDSKKEVLQVGFEFTVKYSGDIGLIVLKGDVVFSDTKEIVNETFTGWEKDKKLNAIVHEQVARFSYNKALVKAVNLADSLGLPSPIPLPKFSTQPPKKTA